MGNVLKIKEEELFNKISDDDHVLSDEAYTELQIKLGKIIAASESFVLMAHYDASSLLKHGQFLGEIITSEARSISDVLAS